MRLKDFYADPERATSQELGFGSAWRAQSEGPWKVVWMEATGEIVAFNERTEVDYTGANRGGGQSLADLPFTIAVEAAGVYLVRKGRRAAGHGDEVVIIGVETDLLRLRGALIGWEDHMPEENGLAWLTERVDDLSAGQTG